jgi:hypothetical protein
MYPQIEMVRFLLGEAELPTRLEQHQQMKYFIERRAEITVS